MPTEFSGTFRNFAEQSRKNQSILGHIMTSTSFESRVLHKTMGTLQNYSINIKSPLGIKKKSNYKIKLEIFIILFHYSNQLKKLKKINLERSKHKSHSECSSSNFTKSINGARTF